MDPRPLPSPDLLARASQYVERSDGLHLSKVLHDIMATLDPKRFSTLKHGGPDWARITAGLIFERALELAWLDRECDYRPELIRPGEIVCPRSGIICTPDAVDIEVNAVEEYKATWMSSRSAPSGARFWHWWQQVTFYAGILDMRTVRVWGFFVNGNYSYDDTDPASGPHILGWEKVLTDDEVDTNYRIITTHAKKRGWL